MKKSIKTGFSFGLTSGIITTLGLMVGMYSGTGSKMIVIGAIITIAIADAFSDALGIHISEESDKKNRCRSVWESTITTFFAKFIFALSFIIPILLFKLQTGIIVGAVYGLFMLGLFSYYLHDTSRKRKWKAVIEHLLIAMVVIFITYFVGKFVECCFISGVY